MIAAALAVGAGALGLTDAGERRSLDARFDLRGTRTSTPDVVVVGIDGPTIGKLGGFPFRRSYHARVIRRLKAAGARLVAYDVQFTEETVPKEDTALYDAVLAAKPVVLSTTEVDERGGTSIFGGDDVVRSAGARAGNTAIDVDADGTLRRFSRSIDRLDTLPVAAVEAATGKQVGRGGFDEEGQAYVDFVGPPGAIRTYSFLRVLRGREPDTAFRGKIVVVGATAPALQDFHTVSTSTSRQMTGPEFLASAVQTLLDGIPLRPAPAILGTLLTLLLAAVAPLAGLRFGTLLTLLAAVSAGVLAAVAIYVAFRHGRVLPVVGPGLGLAFGTVGGVAVLAFYAVLERERTRTLFGRFVSATVVDQVLASTDGEVRLGGVRVDATVLFCDLRGSTALLETMAPERGIEVLNRFLSEMTDAVLEHEGTLVGFRGDGLMALFGAPLAQHDHAERALAAATEMAGPRLKATNDWLAARDPSTLPLALGVGLDSGEVMAGNVGSETRMEYTAIGDAANVAARVEALTKTEGRPVLLTAATRARLGPASSAGLTNLGPRGLRGREAAVELWAPQQE